MRTRTTSQRRAIMEAVRSAGGHPTAYDVFESVRRTMPRVSLGTVYRNLDVLAQMGVVKKIETAGSQMRFDAGVGPHCHVVCTECGRIEDISDASFRGVGVPTEVNGFKVTGQRVELLGQCPACLQSAAAAGTAVGDAPCAAEGETNAADCAGATT